MLAARRSTWRPTPARTSSPSRFRRMVAGHPTAGWLRAPPAPRTRSPSSAAPPGYSATVGKVWDEALFYLQSRGITKAEAEAMIVNGFIEPFTKELPIEYAVELNRLIQPEMIAP